MKLVRILLALGIFVVAFPQIAQPSDTNATTDAQNSTEEPISLSFGPQEDGGFGMVIKGAAYYPLRRFINPVASGQVSPLKKPHFGGFFTPSAYLYLAPEVNWGSEPAAQNQYSLSVRPSFQVGYQKDVRNLPPGPDGLPPLPASLPWQIWPQTAPFFEAYLDVRRHSAQAETNDSSSASDPQPAQNTDATFYGAGVSIAVPFVSRAIEAANFAGPDFEPGVYPMIRITYYKSDGASDDPIGSDIKADQLDASLNFALPLPPYLNVKPRLDFDGDLSRPLTGDDRKWKSLVKAALMIEIANSQFKPVLSYTSGQKFGFQYDRQMLLGIAFDLAGTRLNGQ